MKTKKKPRRITAYWFAIMSNVRGDDAWALGPFAARWEAARARRLECHYRGLALREMRVAQFREVLPSPRAKKERRK